MASRGRVPFFTKRAKSNTPRKELSSIFVRKAKEFLLPTLPCPAAARIHPLEIGPKTGFDGHGNHLRYVVTMELFNARNKGSKLGHVGFGYEQ